MIYPTTEFWKEFKETNGALSCSEALAIIQLAAQAPRGGYYMELGVFNGKSAMSACVGFLNPTTNVYSGKVPSFTLVDPIFSDKETSDMIYDKFKNGLTEMSGITWHIRSTTSIEEIPNRNDYAYVMVDSGSHQDGLPMEEAKLLEDRIVKDGIIVWHDWDSQFKEVKEASDYLVSTGKYEYIPINWNEIVSYVRENNLEAGNNSWHHQEMEFPCFVGAVKRKGV